MVQERPRRQTAGARPDPEEPVQRSIARNMAVIRGPLRSSESENEEREYPIDLQGAYYL